MYMFLLLPSIYCLRLILSELELNEVTCVVDDNLETDCISFIESGISTDQCTVDIKFTYIFQNTGPNCINIASIKAELGPLGTKLLEFSDVYGYLERNICTDDIWTIPDRRSSVNLCEQSYTAPTWDISIDVDDFNGRTTNMESNYTWSISPSTAPSIQPSMAPTIDTCMNCTLTGIVSGGKSFE